MNKKCKVKSVAIVTSIHPDFDARIWKHASSLAREGIDVHLICPWSVENLSTKEGVVFHTFNKCAKRWQRPFVIPPQIGLILFPLLRQVDVVHFHDIDLLPWMTILSLGKKVVYDVHENYADEALVRHWVPKPLRWPLYYSVLYGERILSRIIGNVVLVTPYQEKNFNSPSLQKVYVKNYATKVLLESVEDNYIERDAAVIFIGSQHLNNGSMLYLEIVERVSKLRSNVKFYASDRFGSEDFRNAYLEKRRLYGLEERLELLPNVPPPQLMSILNKATIACNPNLRVPQQIKGIHTKLFEFMAAGIPVVTSDLPHQQAVIEDTNAGILAKPEDVDSFVNSICKLVDDRELCQQFGQDGQKAFIEKYSWESQMPKLIDLYNLIVS
ncbi:MAG: glycosyltransferase family 4 protein [Gammaproteobacteria bacterium]|nr:glycosyltransferase family 4 protein [Gammaproteobacteria bacterium]